MQLHRITTGIVAAILFCLGCAKLLDSTANHSFFQEPDPVFALLTNRQLMMLAGAFEIAVAAFIWREEPVKRRSAAILWFCGLVILYKFGVHLTYDLRPCSCLGIFGRTLKLSTYQLEQVTWLMLVLFTIVATFAWAGSLRSGRSVPIPQPNI